MITPTQQKNLKNFIFTLRSGLYKQNQVGVLRTTEDEFCPRGVIHDLRGGRWGEKTESIGVDVINVVNVNPELEAEYLGIPLNTLRELVQLNVRENKSFAYQADWLEKYAIENGLLANSSQNKLQEVSNGRESSI